MKVKAAIKKIESTLKIPVTQVDDYFYATFENVELRFKVVGRYDYDNPESALENSASNFHIQPAGDQSQPEYDEFVGWYVDNIAQLISAAVRLNDQLKTKHQQIKEAVTRAVRKISSEQA